MRRRRALLLGNSEYQDQNIENISQLQVGALYPELRSAVIASLWGVSERSTAILITIFFQQWRQLGLSASAALRKAQLVLRDALCSKESQNYFKRSFLQNNPSSTTAANIMGNELKMLVDDITHPYYWAGFTYSGL